MVTSTVCPYCQERPADSDDHIFPQLLGGRSCIRVCNVCNSRFGHSFEGRASSVFGSIYYFLARNGAWAPKDTSLSGALSCPETGVPFDVTPAGTTRMSRISVREEEPKKVRISAPDVKTAMKIAKRMMAKRGGRIWPDEPILRKQEVVFSRFQFGLSIDNDIRRLAVKMVIALLRRFEDDEQFVSRSWSNWLCQEGGADPLMPVRFLPHSLVPTTSPRPSHSIFFNSNSASGQAIGTVRLFDLFSIYFSLNRVFDRNVAYLGSLDLIDRTERFEKMEPIDLRLPSEQMPHSIFGFEQIESRRRLDSLLRESLGTLDWKFAPTYWEARLLMGT